MNGESSKRGAVEEIISKRLKVLNKKIARIKSYDQSTLNADQKLAVASLPPLEAVAKELEELIKPGGPVETAELAQAGQIRELKEGLIAEHEEEVQREFKQHKKTYHRKLGGFLRLHHNLSQPNLREKITAQDVFMIREMYEQLKAGKEVDLDIELLQVNYEEQTPNAPITRDRDDETSEGFSTPARSPIVPLEPTPPPVLPVSNMQGSQGFTFTVEDEVSNNVDENKVEETPKLVQDTPKTVDWAEEVDEEGPIFGTPALAEGQKEISGKQEDKPVLAPVVQDTQTSSKSKKGRGQGKPKASSREGGANGHGNSSSPRPQSTKGKSRSQDGNKQGGDDDGFEQVVRKQASSRGRGGGAGAGAGAGGRGRGRGRGGINGAGAGAGNGARNGSGVKAKLENGKEGQ